MFNLSKVQTGLSGLVGIRQPIDPALDIFDASTYLSTSGLFVDDVEMFSISHWDSTQDFKDATKAQKTQLMDNIQKSVISNICSQVFNSWDHAHRSVLFTRSSDRTKSNDLAVGSFYGYELKPSQMQDQGFMITDVRLEFEGTGDLTLFLYNSQQPDLIYEKTVSITSKYQIESLDWLIDSTESQKGTYYFGFIADGTLKPYDRVIGDSIVMNSIKNMNIRNFIVSDFVEFDDIFMVKSEVMHNGLNPTITVYDDFTDAILTNKSLFAKSIQLQWAISLMISYVSTNRSNKNERIGKELIVSTLQVIDGIKTESYYKQGLRSMLGSEIKRIAEEVNKLRQSYLGSDDSFKVLTVK